MANFSALYIFLSSRSRPFGSGERSIDFSSPPAPVLRMRGDRRNDKKGKLLRSKWQKGIFFILFLLFCHLDPDPLGRREIYYLIFYRFLTSLCFFQFYNHKSTIYNSSNSLIRSINSPLSVGISCPLKLRWLLRGLVADLNIYYTICFSINFYQFLSISIYFYYPLS